MFNLKKKILLATFVAATCVSSVSASVLDTFDYDEVVNLHVDGAGAASDSQTLFDATETSPAGDVTYTLDLNSDINPGTDGVTVQTFIGFGELYYSEQSGADSTLTMFYNDASVEADAAAAGLAAFNAHLVSFPGDFVGAAAAADAAAFAIALANAQDFTDAGTATNFYFDVLRAGEGFTLDLTLEDIFGNVSSAMLTVAAEVFSPTRLYLDFGAFAGLADFSLIKSVTAVLDSPEGSDLILAEVGTIPEPTTLAILGLGLLGFAASRKRKA